MKRKWKKEIRETIQNISSSNCPASLYDRRTFPGRRYLPSEMRVTKIHRTCSKNKIIDKCPIFVLQCFHARLYSLAFGQPATGVHVCRGPNVCAKSRFKIKKNRICQKKRKRVFSNICFIAIARQLYMYVFGIVRHFGKGMPQNWKNVLLFEGQ